MMVKNPFKVYHATIAFENETECSISYVFHILKDMEDEICKMLFYIYNIYMYT